jgi:hypothetical protein
MQRRRRPHVYWRRASCLGTCWLLCALGWRALAPCCCAVCCSRCCVQHPYPRATLSGSPHPTRCMCLPRLLTPSPPPAPAQPRSRGAGLPVAPVAGWLANGRAVLFVGDWVLSWPSCTCARCVAVCVLCVCVCVCHVCVCVMCVCVMCVCACVCARAGGSPCTTARHLALPQPGCIPTRDWVHVCVCFFTYIYR